MFVIIAPKVPHFIGVAVGQGQSATPWRGRGGRGRSIVSRGLRRGYALLDLGLRKTHLFEVPPV